MSQLIELPVERLSPESFASRRVGFTIDGTVDLHVVRYDSKPMEFHLVERHLHVTETRVPLTPEPVVLVVAQSTSPDDRAAPPSLESFRAFLLNGRQGVLLGTGTWGLAPGTPWTVFRCARAMPISS